MSEHVITDQGRAELAAARVELLRREGRYDEALATLEASSELLSDRYISIVAQELREQVKVGTAGTAARTADTTTDVPTEATPSAASRAATDETALPTEFALGAAYPNPSSGTVTVPFELPEAAEVEVSAYDLLGRRVATVATGHYEPGRYTTNLDGHQLARGTYVLRIVMSPAAGTVRAFVQPFTLVR